MREYLVPLGLVIGATLVSAQSNRGNLPYSELSPQSAGQKNGLTHTPVLTSTGSAGQSQGSIHVNSDLVVLPLTAVDRSGNPVPDLRQLEVRVFDDGVEQSIESFTAEAFPHSMVVLVDDDLKSTDAGQMVRSLRAIAAAISSDDEILVCRFDILFYAGEGFTGDVDKLWAELEDAQEHSGPSAAGPTPPIDTGRPINGHSTTGDAPVVAAPTNAGSRLTKALDDAVYSAAQLLQNRGRSRRKVILLISDGVNGSQFNHFTYGETLASLLRNSISVYSLAVGAGRSLQRFSRLSRYSNDSGGDIYYAAKRSAMERLYSRITEEARHEYTVAYVPVGNNPNSNYHSVEVHTTRKGIDIRMRTGYYTGPLMAVPQL